MNLVILPEARNDLDDAVEYLIWKTDDWDLAERLNEEFFSQAEHVRKYGTIYRKVIDDYRHVVTPVFHYLMFYWISGDDVVVTYFAHSSRDPDRIRVELRNRNTP